MGLSITVRGDTAGLWRWLDREDDLRGRVRARPGLPADEEMGAEFVVLVAIAATSALARSVCEYVIDRAALTLEIIRENGRVDQVPVTASTDPAELTRLMLAEADRAPA